MKRYAVTAAIVALMASSFGYVIEKQRADRAELLHRIETIEKSALFMEGSPIWGRQPSQ